MAYLPDLIALLAVAVFFGCGVAVGRGRGKYGVHAPATSGHPDFDRLFRVQMNTLEALVMFLPALWIAARYGNPAWVGGLGVLWVVARIWYAISYAYDAGKRGPGFGLGMLATVGLWSIAGWGLLKGLLAL